MNSDRLREIRERYELARSLLGPAKRGRILSYGSDTDILLLLCFDDLGELIDLGSQVDDR